MRTFNFTKQNCHFLQGSSEWQQNNSLQKLLIIYYCYFLHWNNLSVGGRSLISFKGKSSEFFVC